MSDLPALPDGKLIIGLTGNIATGKSAVMRLAAERDVLTIDADKVVHTLLNEETAVQEAIAEAFGAEVRAGNGRIIRPALGQIVFNDPVALKRLEAILHPAVHHAVFQQISETPATIIMIEAIKLLDGRFRSICHQIWVTRCKRKQQLLRLQVCRGMDKPGAESRINAQSPQADKVAQADVVIDTGGLMRDTQKQFEMAWSRLPNPADVKAKKQSTTNNQQPTINKRPKPSISQSQISNPQPEVEQSLIPNLKIRRARPSDVAAILLLVQKATEGTAVMSRMEMLQAFGERSYLIGQVEQTVQAVVGWHIDGMVSRVDQLYFYPAETAVTVGPAILTEIEKSANQHICDLCLAFLPQDTPTAVRQLFINQGYAEVEKEALTRSGQTAVDESRPPDTFIMVKYLH